MGWISVRIKRSWLLSVSGLVWIMGCVKARWFADRTHKATKGLPVFYVQELAFRDLWSKQSVNIFSLGPTAFFSAEGLESIILRKISSELHVYPLKKMKNLLQQMMYFYILFGVPNFWYQDFSWDKPANEKSWMREYL